jgi:predicted  nucleic acid-binding Zn-ribbon protein
VLAHRTSVQKREETLARAQEAVKTVRMMVDAKQVQLKASEEKIARLRRQLNEASSNREYQALKDQIAASEMTNSVLTDEILEAMEKTDEHAATAAEAEAILAKAREEAARTEQEIEQDAPLIEADVARLTVELKEAEEALPADFRGSYHRVVAAKGEEALAPVQGQFCGGCHQHVPLNMIQKMMASQPTFCRSCGRLLYLPEGHSL